MKRCLRCLEHEDDSVRFCINCGTELFYAHRFPGWSNGKMNVVIINGTEVKGCTYHIKGAIQLGGST